MEKKYYKLDREAFVRELKRYGGMKAVRFNLPEDCMYGGEYAIGIIEILYDNPERKNLLHYGVEMSEQLLIKTFGIDEGIDLWIEIYEEDLFDLQEGEEDVIILSGTI